MLCPGAMSHKTRCSSDAVAEKKSAKLALFIQELFPGGLFGASCLFSWLWWTVSWTLRCTLPSAVKHNATRLHHSRVWGYRWPAVCLCSSPLGQLEPSISRPPSLPPLCLSVRAWPATQRYKGVSSGPPGGHFYASFLLFQGLLGQSHLTFSCCKTFLYNHANLLTVLAFLPLLFT